MATLLPEAPIKRAVIVRALLIVNVVVAKRLLVGVGGDQVLTANSEASRLLDLRVTCMTHLLLAHLVLRGAARGHAAWILSLRERDGIRAAAGEVHAMRTVELVVWGEHITVPFPLNEPTRWGG